MYRAILLILYLLVLLPTIIHLVRYRDVPGSRRLSAGLGVAGVLLAPTVAAFLYELLASVLSIVLTFLIILCVFGMILKFIFR